MELLNLHKFDLPCLNGQIKSLIVTSCLISFYHSPSQFLARSRLPRLAGRAVIDAKEPDSCQAASVMAKSLRR